MKSFFALKGGQDKKCRKASEQENSHFGKREQTQSPSLAQVYHPAKQTHGARAIILHFLVGLNIPLCLNL